MADYSGWSFGLISGPPDKVPSSTSGNTITTSGTGAGNEVLSVGETFTVGVTTFTYVGEATQGGTTGFRATSGADTFFFALDGTLSNTATVNGATGIDFAVCFLEGTRILTSEGEVPVEALKPDDLVAVQDSAAETGVRYVPVRWIGRQVISTLFANRLHDLPIRIRTGALGENLPKRDLLVSPSHALLIDGILIQAGALVNGTSIVRERDVSERFTYYHIETEAHLLVLAEGVPAETFVDNVGRENFHNWSEHEQRIGHNEIVEMDLPRCKAARQVPVATQRRLTAIAEQRYGRVAAAA